MRKCVIVMLVCAALYGCSGSADAPATEMYCYDDTAFLCERYPEADSIYHVTVAIDIEVPKGKQWQWLRDSIASDRQYDSESEDNWMADTAALGRYVHGFIDKYYSDINIPFIVTSNMNRSVENREGYEGKLPQISDLRSSGAIENAADSILLLFRPEYYRIFEDSDHHDLHCLEKVIIAKNKYGDTGEVWLRYNDALGTVRDMDQNRMKPSRF